MVLKPRTATQWAAILVACDVRPSTAQRWAPVFAEHLTALSDGEDELDDFLGQVLHESAMLERMVENLNYGASGLFATWPSRFDEETAREYEHQPKRIANKVYANRLGNGDEASGDGWNYRGRAHIMGTGKDAYLLANKLFGAEMGVDFLAEPDRLADPAPALRFSIAWWEGHIPDAYINDIVKVTKRVNGGVIGIAHRRRVTEAARAALDAA